MKKRSLFPDDAIVRGMSRRYASILLRFAALAPWWCAGLHILGLVVIALVLPGGTEVEPDPLERARYIAEHVTLWQLGWGLWMLAAVSLVGFYAWWGARIASTRAGVLAPILAAAGMVCDLTGESISSLVLVEYASSAVTAPEAWDVASFLSAQRAATLLTAGAANALYTAGGVVLTLHTPGLPRPVRWGMWATWIAGAGMTVSALAGSTLGMIVTTACLFPTFILWNLWLARRWRG